MTNKTWDKMLSELADARKRIKLMKAAGQKVGDSTVEVTPAAKQQRTKVTDEFGTLEGENDADADVKALERRRRAASRKDYRETGDDSSGAGSDD